MDELTDELVALAVELINEYGAELVYDYTETGAYNPATSSAAIISHIIQPVKGLAEDYSAESSGQAFASGLIRVGDKKFYLAGGDLTPVVGGNIKFNNDIYAVMNVKSYYAANTPVLHEVQGRK
jgi:hypothetical protein